jgi:hypothetical protein
MDKVQEPNNLEYIMFVQLHCCIPALLIPNTVDLTKQWLTNYSFEPLVQLTENRVLSSLSDNWSNLKSRGMESMYIDTYIVHSFIDPIVRSGPDIGLIIKRLDCKETIEWTTITNIEVANINAQRWKWLFRTQLPFQLKVRWSLLINRKAWRNDQH